MQYENSIGVFKITFHKWIHRFTVFQVTHDCGFFMMDISLLYFAFDLVTLFVFAMI